MKTFRCHHCDSVYAIQYLWPDESLYLSWCRSCINTDSHLLHSFFVTVPPTASNPYRYSWFSYSNQEKLKKIPKRRRYLIRKYKCLPPQLKTK
jgi:hypothetical protein